MLDEHAIDTSSVAEPPAYVVGYLREVDLGDEIAEYLRLIDATLEPYEGRFLIHGGDLEAWEGEWDGDLVVLAFPDVQHARAWYSSEAYQRLVPLRTARSRSMVALASGVHGNHRAVDKLSHLLDGGA